MKGDNKPSLLDRFPSNIEQLHDAAGDDIVPTLVGYAGAVLAPPVGAAIQNWIIARRIRRIEDFLLDFCKAVSRFEERKSREKVNSEEFEFLFTSAIDSVSSKQRQEKAEFYRNLLINHLVSEDNNIEREEIYMNELDDLSYIELVVLSWFHKGLVGQYNGKVDKKNLKEKERRTGLVGNSGFTDFEINVAITRLDNKGYFESQGGIGPQGFVWEFWNFRGWLNDFAKDFLDCVIRLKN